MIIGLGFKKRTGKDTVADYLVEKYGFTRLGFATKLKEMAVDVNPTFIIGYEPWAFQDLLEYYGNDWDAVKQEAQVRKFLQRLGVAARKHLGENVWVNAVAEQVGWTGDFVVSDVRFPNEADWVHSFFDGQLWRLDRDTGLTDNHESETALDDYDAWDVVIPNNEGVDALYARVDGLLEP